MMCRGLPGVVGAVALWLLVLGLLFGGSELAQGQKPVSVHPPGLLAVTANAGFAPKALPAARFSPVSFAFAMRVRTDDASAPPSLREVTLHLDRDVIVAVDDLPTCRRSILAGRGLRAIQKTCVGAIAGGGNSEFVYTGPPIGPIAGTGGGLLIVNGGTRRGVITLYAVDTFSPTTSAVVTMPIEVRPEARGTRLTMTVPPSAGSRGPLTDLSLLFSRETAIFKARCRDGAFSLQAEERFADGALLKVGMERDCVSKPAR